MGIAAVGIIFLIGLNRTLGISQADDSDISVGDSPLDLQSTPTTSRDDQVQAISSEGILLFQDNFSDPKSGWSTGEYPDGITSHRGSATYQSGVFRIVVIDPNWSLDSDPGLIIRDRIIEIDATIPGMMDEEDVINYGVGCWFGSDMSTGYQFFITNHGYYGVTQTEGGLSKYVGMSEWQHSDAINATTSEGVTNHIRVDCVEDTVGFYVNDVLLTEIANANVSFGGISIFAGTYPDTQFGADVLFDDFKLYGVRSRIIEPMAGTDRVREIDGASMVYVPSGSFVMGSTDAELQSALELCNQVHGDCKLEWWDDEQPAHNVYLESFWIDQTEVSNGQFQDCVRDGLCTPPHETHSAMEENYYGNPVFDNYPVIYITWDQANTFCQWAGGRLPSEAEWEYAARSSEGHMFPWGDEFHGPYLNYCDANCPVGTPDQSVDDGFREVGQVGSYRQNPSWVGALDMAGNVWEFVSDWYGRYPSEAVHDPHGPDSGDKRIIRSGAWDTTSDSSRSANRSSFETDAWNYAIGFRCAESISSGFVSQYQGQTDSIPTDPPPTDPPPSEVSSLVLTEIQRWDTGMFEGNDGSVFDMSLSPDGELLAVGIYRGVVVYRLDPFEELWREDDKEQHAGGNVSFSPDGTILAGFIYHNIVIREPLSGDIIRAMELEAPWDLGFSPDGRKLVSNTGRGQMPVWDPDTGAVLMTIDAGQGMVTIDFSPDGITFVTGNSAGRINFWSLIDGSLIKTLKDEFSIEDIDISADGKLVATDNGNIWDISSGELLHTLGDPNEKSMTFSPDGRLLAISGHDTVNIWDPITGDNLWTYREDLGWIDAIEFSPDGKWLLVGTGEGLVIIWSIDD